MPLLLALLLVLAASAGEARAWGEEGHRMVGEIADRLLTETARREVALLLDDDRLAGGEPSHRHTLGEVAYWADEIKDYPYGRKRAAWHFDDIPLCAAADYSRYCRQGRCASAQLERHVRMLADRRVPPQVRNEALKWVVHLMGDIHQPLHAATRGDRGGNQVQVSFFGRRDNPPYGSINLHAIWDVHMVQRLISQKGGERALVSAPISAADRAAWERASIAGVADESHRLARDFVYPMLVGPLSCSDPIRGVVAVDEAYFSRAAPVIESQIRKAGVRLARVLNEVLGAR